MHKTTITLMMVSLAVGVGSVARPHAPDRTDSESRSQAARGNGYVSLDAAGQPLRTRFNDDVGKTRVLMLVAPT